MDHCYKTHRTHFGSLFCQNRSTRFFTKKSFGSILSLHATVTSCKKSEKSHALISSQNLKKLVLGPFWVLFGPKDFPKKKYESILIFSATVDSCKNSGMLHALIFDNKIEKKISFLAHSRPLLAQKPQNKFFPKRIL